MATKKISARAVNKAIGGARWTAKSTAKPYKKPKAKKSTLIKRVSRKVATGTKHLEKASVKGAGSVLRHISASPAQRAAHIKRKQQLH
jgi:BRCT domain type II-containing protein